MKELQDKLQVELNRVRLLCSTNDNYNYAYSYGIEFALNLVKNLNITTNINSKIQETDGLLDRTNKLVDFLDDCDESKVSAGDVMGYICGYVDITSEPEDIIEIFD